MEVAPSLRHSSATSCSPTAVRSLALSRSANANASINTAIIDRQVEVVDRLSETLREQLLTCPDMTDSVLVFAYRVKPNGRNKAAKKPPNNGPSPAAHR